jgi:hypothetical protein
MGGVILLGLVVLAALAGAFIVLLAVKALLWIVLWPVRLAFSIVFGVLLLPLLLLKVLFGGLLFLLMLPLLIVGVVAGVIGLAVPLFPLLCMAFVVWVVMRSSRTTAIVRG